MVAKQLYYDDVDIGDDIGPIEKTISSEQVQRFMTVWGPGQRMGKSRFNDAEVAKSEGLAGPIVPGTLNIAVLSQLITDWSPTVTLRRIDVVFRQSVLQNVPFHVRGVVTDKTDLDGEPVVECDVFMENIEGERLVGGKALVALPQQSG